MNDCEDYWKHVVIKWRITESAVACDMYCSVIHLQKTRGNV